MSIKIMSQVWESGPEKQGHLLVMLALADYSNDAGKCWPSIRSIAEKARMTERGVQKILRALRDGGWIAVEEGVGPRGCHNYKILRRKSETPQGVIETGKYNRLQVMRRAAHTCYYCGYIGVQAGQFEAEDLDVDHVVPRSKGGADCVTNVVVSCKPCNQSKKNKSPAAWGKFMRQNPERYSGEWSSDERYSGEPHDTKTPNDDAKTPNESAKNPEPRSPEPLRTVKNRHLEPSYGSNDLFDRFWAVVPRKKKKQEAKKAFDKACRQADPEQIIKAMELFAITQRDTDPQFIPHPTSWLNQGRWEDEPDHQPENIHDQLSQQMEQAHGIPTARIGDCEAHQRLPAPIQEAGQSGHGTQPYRDQGYGRSDERQNRLFGSR